jgi:hypothetical protein
MHINRALKRSDFGYSLQAHKEQQKKVKDFIYIPIVYVDIHLFTAVILMDFYE